ncbi:MULTISPECIES: ABC transporter substrate-binding protein [unclassified Clostridioides]|uniref:siderophore ABC transporter substrate-binding protein n=1 Tax=unclassified Clostridioides TaxID=2635829 RepID=UPI001D116EB7|nr:ABC transporter substrate-binding protein [Clostridioides sp. ES-S-0049-03]MCC0674724.1 ABC transporter substrate-binding protein [Clostridioides sp. ES-W-0018-02]MCC0710461.1 ABC transporter substrate-binding protein [Clostridioides sp. ES-W-0017-02]
MNKKAAIIATVAIVGLVAVFALGGSKKSDKKTLDASNATIKITHSLGETDVKLKPKKVVVFDYSALDTMDALGVSESLVGLPKSSLPVSLEKYKDEKYADLGGLKEPDLESIKSTNPDLIIINGRQEDFYEQLSKIAPTISTSKDDKKYLESVKNNINKIAKIFGVEEKANQEFAKIEKKIEVLNKKVTEKDLNALTLMVNEGNLSVFGEESRFSILYNSFGFKNKDKNIKESSHGQNITFEYVAKQNPDIMFVIDRGIATGSDVKAGLTAKSVLNNDVIKSMDAYKNDNIICLDAPTWYVNDGGLTSLNKMIDDASKAVNK